MSPSTQTPSSTSDGFDQARVVEPQRTLDAEELEDRVDRAGARVEEEHERDDGRDRRHERGQVEQRCARIRMPASRAHEQRRRPASAVTMPHRHQDHARTRACCRRPIHDLRVLGEQVLVVAQADPLRVGQQVVAREAVEDGCDQRVARRRSRGPAGPAPASPSAVEQAPALRAPEPRADRGGSRSARPCDGGGGHVTDR